MNGSSEDFAALERAIERDPGDPRFAALAEAHRRAGRLGSAERVAKGGLDRHPEAREGRLVLGMVLLDQGRNGEARSVLAQLLEELIAAAAAAPRAEALSDSELDDAFDRAETDRDELIDPDRVAAEAVAHVDAGAGDGLDEGTGDALPIGGAFATATMAELLERQGDESGASRIRAALGSPPASRAGRGAAHRQLWIDTLERWLGNLRGDRV